MGARSSRATKGTTDGGAARPRKRKGTPRSREAAAPKVHERVAQRSEAVAREAGHRRWRRITLALAVPAVIASGFVILHSSLFNVRSVTVVGASETSRESVIVAAGLTDSPPLIDVNPVAVAGQIEALPWIASATVIRHWPHGVTIDLVERQPMIEANISRRRWELFDTSARALGFRSSRTSKLVRIARTATMPLPGTSASGTLAGEIAVARALPLSLVGEITIIGNDPRTGLTMTLAGHTLIVVGTATNLSQKMNALITLAANGVVLSAEKVVNLTVSSSPVVTPAG